jgi:hypothetical protein
MAAVILLLLIYTNPLTSLATLAVLIPIYYYLNRR